MEAIARHSIVYLYSYVYKVAAWRWKVAKSGGANILKRKYFYDKNQNPM